MRACLCIVAAAAAHPCPLLFLRACQPATGAVLESTGTVPNHALRAVIDDYLSLAPENRRRMFVPRMPLSDKAKLSVARGEANAATTASQRGGGDGSDAAIAEGSRGAEAAAGASEPPTLTMEQWLVREVQLLPATASRFAAALLAAGYERPHFLLLRRSTVASEASAGKNPIIAQLRSDGVLVKPGHEAPLLGALERLPPLRRRGSSSAALRRRLSGGPASSALLLAASASVSDLLSRTACSLAMMPADCARWRIFVQRRWAQQHVSSVAAFAGRRCALACGRAQVQLLAYGSASGAGEASHGGNGGGGGGVSGGGKPRFTTLVHMAANATCCATIVRRTEYERACALGATARARIPLRAAVGTSDGEIRVWEIASASGGSGHRELLDLRGHQGAVTCMCAFTSGKLLLSGTDEPEGALRVWELRRGSCVRVLCAQLGAGRSSGVLCCALLRAAADRFAVSGHRDGGLRVWDLAGATVAVACLERHSAPISCVAACGSRGQFVLTGSHDRSIVLWDLRSTLALADGADGSNTLQESEAAAAVVTVMTGHSGRVLCCAAFLDTRVVGAVGSSEGPLKGWVGLSGSEDCSVRLWQLSSGGACMRVIGGHPGASDSLSLTPCEMEAADPLPVHGLSVVQDTDGGGDSKGGVQLLVVCDALGSAGGQVRLWTAECWGAAEPVPNSGETEMEAPSADVEVEVEVVVVREVPLQDGPAAVETLPSLA